MCVMRVRASYDLSTFEFLFYFPYAPWALGSNSVVIEETCAKPFFVLIGLVMLFNSMNLDLRNGGRQFGSRFQGLSVI